MDARDFVQKAYDGNAFTTSQASAGYINPEIWNKEILAHVEANLVVARLGKQYTDLLNKPGDTLNITVGVEPAAASAVAESASVTVSAYTKTQVIFTPSEYGAAYQLTNKEKSRPFYNIMQDMVAELGYKLALKKDSVAVALLQASAGNSVVANGVVSSAIASSDVMNHEAVVNAKVELHKDKMIPYAVIFNYSQLGDLEKTDAARQSGLGDQILANGFIRRYAGMEAYVTTQIAIGSSKSKAIVLGKDTRGLPPFGIAQKVNPYLEKEYHALERYTDIVAVEEYDIKVLRANGICTIESYAA